MDYAVKYLPLNVLEFIYVLKENVGDLFIYWVMGILIGSFISVFCKDYIHRAMLKLTKDRDGYLAIVLASALGIASPLCMYGTIPIAASFAKSGVKEEWIGAFMMSSVLLNPQLIIYSAILGTKALVIRVVSCFICGILAGLLIKKLYVHKNFFAFTQMQELTNHDTNPNLWQRYGENVERNLQATGVYFFLGIILATLLQLYMPNGAMGRLLGGNSFFSVLLASVLGIPVYACGGGTIPLLMQMLKDGAGLSSATAFMLSGPATKITNLGALKIVLGTRGFALYILYVLVYSVLAGMLVGGIFN